MSIASGDVPSSDGLARLIAIIKGRIAGTEVLGQLVTTAHDEHHIVGPGPAQGGINSAPSVNLDCDLAAPGYEGANPELLKDGRWVFIARAVGGEHRPCGLGRHLTHGLAVEPVSAAGVTHHDIQAPTEAGQPPGGP